MALAPGAAAPSESTDSHIDAPQLQLFVMGLFFIFGGITSLNDVIDRQKEASDTLSAYLQYNPTNLTALRLAGYRHLDVGNWNGAILMLERVRNRLGNNDAILLANLARAYAGANQMGKALGYARTAYDLAPANAMVTQIYGQLELKSGKRPKAAMELLQKAQAMMPENQEVAAQLRRAVAAYRKSAKRQ